MGLIFFATKKKQIHFSKHILFKKQTLTENCNLEDIIKIRLVVVKALTGVDSFRTVADRFLKS
jgi:hypothetical protein